MSYQYDKQSGDVIINGFEKGISGDPYTGIADLRNVNITTIPKEASVGFSTAQISPPIIPNGSVTSANNSTYYLTYTGAAGLENYMSIVFSAESGLNVSTSTVYWVTNVGGAGAGTFQITSDYLQTSTVAVTNGTGTFHVAHVSINPVVFGSTGTPKFFTYDAPNACYFMLTDIGDLWTNYQTTTSGYWTFLGNSGTTTGASQGAGLAYYQSYNGQNAYIFVFRNTTIDYLIVKVSGVIGMKWVYGWNPLTGAGSDASQTLNTSTPFHNAYVGQDNVLYWCDGPFLGSVFETPNGPPQTNVFDPSTVGGVIDFDNLSGGTGYSNHTNVSTTGGTGTGCTVNTTESGGIITSITINSLGSGYLVGDVLTITGGGGNATFEVIGVGTYTYAKQALALPTLDQAQCIAELGVNLLIGGQLNKIYPWNRTSTSFTYPILLAEYNVTNLVTVNTSTYIFVGNRGRIWITNGSQASLFAKVPDHLSGTVEPYFTWGGACSNKNKLYFSFNATTNAQVQLATYGGVWAINLDTNLYGVDVNRSLQMTNTLSYQITTYNGYSTVMIPNFGFDPAGTGLLIGWTDNALLRGLDTTISTPYTGANTVSVGLVSSDYVPIGTFLKPTSSGRVEFKLSVPMVSGESVQLFYRQKLSDSFVLVGPAITSSTQGCTGYSYAYTNVPFQNSQWIQIQAQTISTGTNPSYCRLEEIRLGQ